MRYKIHAGPMPTTAGQTGTPTGTSIKTLLQLKPFNPGRIVAWGVSFDGSAAATPILCELLETGTVAATVTAAVDNDCVKMNGVSDVTAASVAGLTMGGTATGYWATAEGSITATRVFDAEFVAPTNQYIMQFPLDQMPVMIAGNHTRIRVTAGASVNARAWIEIEL